MNEKELDLLEKAFGAEIDSAMNNNHLGIIQTKSKAVKSLVESGLLKHVVVNRWPASFAGYVLTDAGRMAYCTSDRCKE